MSFKDVETVISGIWSAIGPLIGVLVGAMLSRAWDRKKWMKDARKEEFKELIEAIADAATALIARRIHLEVKTITQEIIDEATTKNNQALRVMKSRLFISHDVAALNLFERWGQAIKGLGHGGELKTFDVAVDEILEDIVRDASK